MSWLLISLRFDGSRAAEAGEDLEALGASSVTLEDAADEPVLEPAPGETPLWPSVVVTALFDSAATERLRALQGTPGWAARSGFHLSHLADRAWEREWLRDFRPMRFGRRLWVCPGEQPPGDDTGLALRLDPGLAFGTGTHPTTALCLEWLDAHPPAGLRVVDYGCGSGILAIAAALLGARRVAAVDIDPQALTATMDNARRNGVDEVISPSAADGTVPPADLIVANILSGPLIELAPAFARGLGAGATLLLSGILADQADAVARAYAPWFAMDDREDRAGWVRLAGRRKEAD